MHINQDDPDEKLHAVANMDAIYRNASRVCILLEDVSLHSSEALALRKWFHVDSIGQSARFTRYMHATDFGETAISPVSFFNAFQKIHHSRWFRRAWCRQEHVLSWSADYYLVDSEGYCQDYNVADLEAFEQQAFKSFENVLPISVRARRLHIEHGLEPMFARLPSELFEYFVRLNALECTYREDIVSIALNTSGIYLSYSKKSEVKCDTAFILAVIALGAGDVSVLEGRRSPIYKPFGYQVGFSPLYKKESAIGSKERATIHCTIPDEWGNRTLTKRKAELDAFFLESQPRRWPPTIISD
jgi:hypothetical protein